MGMVSGWQTGLTLRPAGLRGWLGRRSIAAGLVAGALLLAVYLGLISLAQGAEHALEQLATDAPFVSLVTAAFALQVAMFVEIRAIDRRHRAAAVVTTAGAGTSAAAMLACCAHHLVDLLPILGLSAATALLEGLKGPLFIVGIAMSLLGVVIVGRRLRAARRACAAAGVSSSPAPSPTGP